MSSIWSRLTGRTSTAIDETKTVWRTLSQDSLC